MRDASIHHVSNTIPKEDTMTSTTYLDELKKILKTDERLVTADGVPLKSKVTELAQNFDEKLVESLLKNEKLSTFFFKTISGVKLFDIEKFLDFVHNEAYLSDSYTAYKNKIGLATSKNNYLTEQTDIVLNWPYRDCILEGGQDKEDEKNRNEVFWNETLGADQRDVLLAPKVLDSFTRFDKDGEHSVEKLSEDDNFILRGNNLLALYTLKKRYGGKVKLIYIDPPYNTGDDSFGYNDRFKHSTWLTFMKNRLTIAWELLADDGAIFVHCDHHELGYVNVLMDEIFNIGNKVQVIACKTASPAGFKTVNPGPIDVTEYILFYTKNKSSYKFKKGYVEVNYDKNYNKVIENITSKPEEWIIKPIAVVALEDAGFKTEAELKAQFGSASKIIKQQIIGDFAYANADKVFSIRDPHKPTDTLKKLLDESKEQADKVYSYSKASKEVGYVMNGGALSFYSSKLKEIDGKIVVTELLTDFWSHISWAGIAKEGGVKLKNGKKPEKLLKQILELATEPGDIVMDYHLGSGTTAAVAHKMGRRYIGIEQLDYGKSDATVRLKNTINGDQTGISKAVNWQAGGSFVYAELKNDAKSFIDDVQAAGDKKSLEQLLSAVLESNFLSHRVDPKKFEKDEFTKLEFADQKRLVIDLVNKNKLYVNYHDMGDSSYTIDKTTQQLNTWMQSRD